MRKNVSRLTYPSVEKKKYVKSNGNKQNFKKCNKFK